MDNCLLCQEQFFVQPDFINWLLAENDFKKSICDICLLKFERIGDVICPECGRKQVNNNLCKDCRLWMQKDGAIRLQHRAIFTYNQAAKKFFHQFKFVGDYRLKNSFNFQIDQLVPKADIYISIPIDERTLNTRGFNQVNALFGQLPIEKNYLLAKEKSVQSHNNRKQRLKLVNPFYLNQYSKTTIRDKQVILIDDIYTTGATIRNAATLIASQHPKSIRSFSLIR